MRGILQWGLGRTVVKFKKCVLLYLLPNEKLGPPQIVTSPQVSWHMSAKHFGPPSSPLI